MKKVVLIVTALVLCAAIGIGSWKLFEFHQVTRAEERVREEMAPFAPDLEHVPEGGVTPAADDGDGEVRHPGLVQAQGVAGSVVGWLRVTGTRIDYPVAQGPDNLYYLKRDVKGRESRTGAIFMDCRCLADYSLFNTVIYGHNTSNGSMFADLRKYRTKSYFEGHQAGYIATPTHTYRLEIFAYMTVGNTAPAYKTAFVAPADKTEHLRYLRENAKWYRDIGVTEDDHLVTLSTCTYEFENARSVVVARIRMAE